MCDTAASCPTIVYQWLLCAGLGLQCAILAARSLRVSRRRWTAGNVAFCVGACAAPSLILTGALPQYGMTQAPFVSLIILSVLVWCVVAGHLREK